MGCDQSIIKYLPLVKKPARYIGGEVNSIKKDPETVSLTFGLGFPDTYEVGMSHLGLQVLYQTLNACDGVACERVFAPWKDMETLMREKGVALSTLESNIALSDLDIMGFSLQYELCYTNVLNMLDMGGIPLRSAERGDDDPIVIGGGPCAFNPEPVAAFFDCFLIGDGEEAVVEIADAAVEAKQRGLDRAGIIEALAGIKGVYVPARFDVVYNPDSTVKEVKSNVGGMERVQRRIVSDLNALPRPTSPVVAHTQAVHDRFTVEVARGCTRGCRFCQAGMTSRPLRERSPGEVERIVTEGLTNTGYDEVGLLSLSTGDYSQVGELITSLVGRFEKDKTGISLPSLRVGTLDGHLASMIKKIRKTGFTLAPEAGTERLRGVINKNVDEAALIKAAEEVFALGWRSIKLYFMIGLPTETPEDLDAIVRLATSVRRAGKRARGGRAPKVSVSISTFIPKPFTPFQWEPQITLDECLEKQRYLRERIKKAGMEFKWHDARMSLLEGAFARGDRGLAGVIERAFHKGCRFDGWGEEFSFTPWEEAFAEEGLNIARCAERERLTGEVFAWDHLDAGPSKRFLLDERSRAREGAATPDCRLGPCTECGVCDHKVIKNVIFAETSAIEKPERAASGRVGRSRRFLEKPPRVRFTFKKSGPMIYLGHLDLVRCLSRALRRVAAPVRFSNGFHPHPKITLSPPIPLGITSFEEFMDVELAQAYPGGPSALMEALNATLPGGIEMIAARLIPLQLPPLSVMLSLQRYMIFLNDGPEGLSIDLKGIDGFLRRFLDRESVCMLIERKDKTREVDIRPLIEELRPAGEGTLMLTLRTNAAAGVKPHEVLANLLNLSKKQASLIPIHKTGSVL